MADSGLQLGSSLDSILEDDGGLKLEKSTTQYPDIEINTGTEEVATDVATETASGFPLPKQFEDDPSGVRKARFGASETSWLLGDARRLGIIALKSIGPTTWEEAHEEVESKRLDRLYKKFPEFKGGFHMNDPEVWAGRVASMITDPAFYIMPWGWGAKALAEGGKLYARGLKLGTVGAGVGAGATILTSTARTGKVPEASQIAMGAALGGILSPVAMGGQKAIGIGLNKIFPNLFKNQKVVTGVMQQLKGDLTTKLDLNPAQLNKLYTIANNPAIKKLNKEVERLTQTGIFLGKPKQVMQNIIKNKKAKLTKNDIKSIQRLDLKSLKNKKIDRKTIEKNETLIFKEVDDLFQKSATNYANAQHKLLTKVMQESYNAGGLTSAFVRALAHNVTRAGVGMGMGATAGTLMTDSEEAFNYFMYGGLALGMTHRVLMRGGIKGIPLAKQKTFAGNIQNFMLNTIDRNARIATSMQQAQKLSQRGPILDEFSNIMFTRFTETPRLQGIFKVGVNPNQAIGKVNSGRSIEQSENMMNQFWARAMLKMQGAVGERYGKNFEVLLKKANAKQNSYIKRKLTKDEQWALDTQKDALKIVRGSTEKTSEQSKLLADKINGYLKEFRKYYSDVGFKEAKYIEKYFPRKFDFKKINENREDFIEQVAKAIGNLRNNKKWKMDGEEKKLIERYNTFITQNKALATKYLQNIEGLNKEPIMSISNGRMKFNSLPLSNHIKFERKLNGKYEQVEKLFEKYLVNDINAVLMDLTLSTTKSVEFARVFGTQGTFIQNYFNRLSQQYANAGWKKSGDGFYGNGLHKKDAEAMRDAVNSYFGKLHFNSERNTTVKHIAATLSTLTNFKMMELVTIANIGDLIQPFQNSRFFLSAFRGVNQKKLSDSLEMELTGEVQNSIRKSMMQSSQTDNTLSFFKGKRFNYANIIGRSNEWYFKAIGLQGITKVARKYAYNVGALDAHRTAQRIVKNLKKLGVKDINDLRKFKDKSSLEDIKWLTRLNLLNIGKNGNILNSDDIIRLGSTNKISDAVKTYNSRLLLQRAGNYTANRDAIIPTVGNRLLFTQSQNPLARLIGQFSSWAMAKSSQTNAMISRVESGELKTAIGMLGGLSMYGGIKEFKQLIKNGSVDGNIIEKATDKKTAPDFWAESMQYSGMLGWLPNIVLNTLRYDSGRPFSFVPAMEIVQDFWGGTISSVSERSPSKFFKSIDNLAPFPTLRKFLSRFGIPVTYKPDYNIREVHKGNKKLQNIIDGSFSTGGLVNQVRQLFSTGDVVKKNTFNDEFSKARDNKQELFSYEGRNYTTKLAGENDEDFKQHLNLAKLNNKTILQEVADTPSDKKVFDKVLKDASENTPVIKPKPGTKIYVDEKKIYNYLINEKKLSANKALGIMANIQGESGFQINADEVGDGSEGIGLLQHTYKTRKEGLLKAVPNYRVDWKGQINYALSEQEAKNYLKQNFKTAEEAAEYFMNYNLKPAEKVIRNGKKINLRKERTKEHNTYLQNFVDRLKFQSGGLNEKKLEPIQLYDASGPHELADKRNNKFLQELFDKKEKDPVAKSVYDVKSVVQRKKDDLDVHGTFIKDVKSFNTEGLYKEIYNDIINNSKKLSKTDKAIYMSEPWNTSTGVETILHEFRHKAFNDNPSLKNVIKKTQNFILKKYDDETLAEEYEEILTRFMDIKYHNDERAKEYLRTYYTANFIDDNKSFQKIVQNDIKEIENILNKKKKERDLFHGGGSVSHTHGPKKSKPTKSWKSLFTSNQAYGGPTPSVNTSNTSFNDNKEKYIASTQGGTNTGGSDNNNNNSDNNNESVLTKTLEKIIKKAKDKDVKVKWRTNVPLFGKDTDTQVFSKLQSLKAEGVNFEGELQKKFFSSTLEGLEGVSGNVDGAVGIKLSSDNPDNIYTSASNNSMFGNVTGKVGYAPDTNKLDATATYTTPQFKPLLEKTGGKFGVSGYVEGNTETGLGYGLNISDHSNNKTFKVGQKDGQFYTGATINFKNGGLLDRKRSK